MTRPKREDFVENNFWGYYNSLEAYIDHLEELAERRLCRIKELLAEAAYKGWEESLGGDL